MAVSQDYRREVVARLSPFVPIVDKSMFGGVGLYGDGLFFAVLDNDRTYFKVDNTNRPDFEAAGMGPFMPFGEDVLPRLSTGDGQGRIVRVPRPLITLPRPAAHRAFS